MKKYVGDVFSRMEVIANSSDCDWESITETAGFEPLEVKMQRFMNNGIRAQFTSDDFTSSELRQIFLDDECILNQYDDLETVIEKTERIEHIKASILAEKREQNLPRFEEMAEAKPMPSPAPQNVGKSAVTDEVE